MKKAVVKWVDGMRFVGLGHANHSIVIDGPADAGGLDSATRPGELVLMALAGCTGIDVVSILNKMHVAFDSFEIGVEAEVAENHPKIYTKIAIEYRIRGKNLPADKLERAIKLSQETYCSVSKQLRPSAEISYRYKILE